MMGQRHRKSYPGKCYGLRRKCIERRFWLLLADYLYQEFENVLCQVWYWDGLECLSMPILKEMYDALDV